jgi:hypothetical protein
MDDWREVRCSESTGHARSLYCEISWVLVAHGYDPWSLARSYVGQSPPPNSQCTSQTLTFSQDIVCFLSAPFDLLRTHLYRTWRGTLTNLIMAVIVRTLFGYSIGVLIMTTPSSNQPFRFPMMPLQRRGRQVASPMDLIHSRYSQPLRRRSVSRIASAAVSLIQTRHP